MKAPYELPHNSRFEEDVAVTVTGGLAAVVLPKGEDARTLRRVDATCARSSPSTKRP